MPKCTINGREIEVEEGKTIIQAMTENGIDIAHYCWHPGLSIAGVCRLCMVEVEGMPKLQIACNTPVKDGMIINNNSEKVVETLRWGMDFHLINHPLDCPVCDQAGECGLQNQYMKFGQYEPEMAERKVKKRKVVDLGSKIVLDTERCILCSRCVRFCEEVTKTNELGIFNRGDRSEIGTFKDRPLENDYAGNTVDICPVGALTSKNFRFRQRVWFLKEAPTVCPGCSTGCSVNAYYNKNGLFRFRPIYNPEVNGHWMCDYGREMYKHVNPEVRLQVAAKKIADQKTEMNPVSAAKEIASLLGDSKDKNGADSLALVLTGQYTLEELKAIVAYFTSQLGSKNIYHWLNNPESINDFDGILLRGDRNPNTKGLERVMKDAGVDTKWSDLVSGVNEGRVKSLVVAGPEVVSAYPDFDIRMEELSAVEFFVWLGTSPNSALENHIGMSYQLPMKTYIEKNGTFVNHKGAEQNIKAATSFVPQALTLEEAAGLFSGGDLDLSHRQEAEKGMVRNMYSSLRGDI